MNPTYTESDSEWAACFAELAPRLVLYARQLAPTAADADDVVQMAFVRWWRRFPNGDRAHIPLLYAAVRSLALDLRRGNQRRWRREQAACEDEAGLEPAYFDTTMERQEIAGIVQESLAGLPQEQREVVTLHLWGGLTFAQIADTLSASINTVAARYRYALKALQRRLEPLREELLKPAPQPSLAALANTQPVSDHA